MMNSKLLRKTLSILLSVLIFSTFLMSITSAQVDAASVNEHVWRSPPPNTPFQDVPRGQWFHPYVSWAWVNGIAEGPGATRFNPSASITRAEFAALMHRIAGSPTVTPGTHFSDVPQSAWFAPTVEWARINRVTTGYPDGTFRPNYPITRQEMAAMIHRTLDPHGTTPAIPARYTDRTSVNRWAVGHVGWAVARGVMGVGINRLNPLESASRAEAVAMLRRAVERLGVSVPGNMLPPEPFINLARGAQARNRLNVGPIEGVMAIDTVPENIHVIPNRPASNTYTAYYSGIHRIEMLRATGTVRMRITSGTFDREIEMIAGTGYSINLPSGEYNVEVSHIPGQPTGVAQLMILPQKGTVILQPEPEPKPDDADDPDDAGDLDYLPPFTEVHDSFQFPDQQNNHTLVVPSTGGVYRFEIDELPFIPLTRVSVNIVVLRGNTTVGTAELTIREGLTLDLDPGTYTIRVTAAEGPRTIPYTLRIIYQGETENLETNERDVTRGDILVSDDFIFVGQQNRYSFTPRYAGVHIFTFTNLPAGGQVYVEVFGHNAFYQDFFVNSAWHGEGIRLREGLEYEIRIRHMAGSTGAYSFIIANPPR